MLLASNPKTSKNIKNQQQYKQVNSWADFGALFTAGRLDVYTLVPIFWALYNAIPPALFFVYFFTKVLCGLGCWEGCCSMPKAKGFILRHSLKPAVKKCTQKTTFKP